MDKHCSSVLELPLGECFSSFNLENAVCNHGFFMMAPNLWLPSTKSLQRPLRLADTITCVTVTISHPPNHPSLLIQLHDNVHIDSLSLADRQAILNQVGRMLRITKKDERAVKEFQQMHPEAKARDFGRLFRAPSLFEDAVKSILLCNCTWARTLKMAEELCNLQPQLKNDCLNNNNNNLKELAGGRKKKGSRKRKKEENNNNIPRDVINNGIKITSSESLNLSRGGNGNFPSARELASLNVDFLNSKCNLGYRARTILTFAKSVELGKINLNKFDDYDDDGYIMTLHEKLIEQLKDIKGFGPFVCANILMCIGCFQNVPADSETVRHLQKVHGKKSCSKRTIAEDVKEIYDKYAPFQCLAYWMELLNDYESAFGKLSDVPKSNYYTIAGSFHSRAQNIGN